MSTERLLLEARLAVEEAVQNEAIVFGMFGIAFLLLVLFFGWVFREWSWIPRKRHDRVFYERF